ncbi:hypothetical protein M0804_004291 [Polistes exclamans]|nr:hypothetical protein M0804_004291 [Polistes exclamans]
MIFTGRSVDALDEVRGSSVVVQNDERRDVKAVAIAAGWFSSLRRPGKRNKKSCQKQAKSAWDLTTLSTGTDNILTDIVHLLLVNIFYYRLTAHAQTNTDT